jgi:hypothetical protein
MEQRQQGERSASARANTQTKEEDIRPADWSSRLSVSDLERAIAKLEPKEGDFLFFDLSAIDADEVKALVEDPPDFLRGIVFIGVHTRHAQSVEDCIFSMSRMELDLLISDKTE